MRTGILLEALNWLFDRVWATALPVPAAMGLRRTGRCRRPTGGCWRCC
ncbi:hypothetical protein ACFQ60_31005 [Streptomyces zhihengii]